MASPSVASPRAISRTASRNDSTWSAIPWANSSISGSTAAPVVRRGPPPVGSIVVSLMDSPPSFERPTQGDLVGVLKVPTDRKSTREPGYPDPQVRQEACEVRRSGLAFQVRVRGQDDLGDRAVGEPGHQLPDAELVGADALDGRDRAAKDVVAAPELAGPLDRDDVLGLL